MGHAGWMRVVIAPDKFAGTLTAVEAARAIAVGWARNAPLDELVLMPLSDGGPGFVDTLHGGLAGELLAVATTTVADWETQYDAVPATLLHVGDTVYIESAQVVGLEVAGESDPQRRSSFGVGVLIAHALEVGARCIVVGVGGTSTNDGGAGLLAALGATAKGADLDDGPAGMRGVTEVNLSAVRELLAGVEVVVATDVDIPLTGLFGATRTFGPQKGLEEADLPWIDGVLEEFAAVTDRKTALEPGAGAGGGIGYALMVLGGRRKSGIELVAEVSGLRAALAQADLAITGEGAFDVTSRTGKVPYGVAFAAQEVAVPCIVLAGRVDIGSREMRTLGVESAYSMSELFGPVLAVNRRAGRANVVARGRAFRGITVDVRPLKVATTGIFTRSTHERRMLRWRSQPRRTGGERGRVERSCGWNCLAWRPYGPDQCQRPGCVQGPRPA
jgi:glycerate kinase